jgi:hypothetical protein
LRQPINYTASKFIYYFMRDSLVQHSSARYAALLGGAFVAIAASFFFTQSAFATAPTTFTSKTFADNNADGTIDRMIVVVNGGEALTACTVTAGELTSDWAYVGNSYGGSIASATCNTGTATITFVITGATAGITGGGTAPTIAYNNTDADNSIANASGNLGTVAAGSLTDAAGPVLMSSNPANGGVGAPGASVSLVFSENVASMTKTISGTTFTTVTTLPASTVVLTGSTNPGATYTFTVVTAPDASANAFAGASTGLATNPFLFAVAGGSASGAGAGAPTAASVEVSSPNGGQTYHAGDAVSISWSGNNQAGSVNLAYTTDGASYHEIASGLGVNGHYDWTVPDVSSSMVMIRARGMDGSTVTATDLSDASFTIIGTGAVNDDADEEGEDMPDGDEVDTQDGAGSMGSSPFTGKAEVITGVHVGDYIRAHGASTVYYIDSGFVRRPFMDLQTFNTYGGAEVDMVTDATLPTLTLGAPMLPKEGTVLVKIQSDARVFALSKNDDGQIELHWIASEAIAKALYGSAWADYVIDVPVTLFSRFHMGSSYSANENVSRTSLMTRVMLNK